MHPQELLRQLDAWEEPLRGYSTYPERVSLEPPFTHLLARPRIRSVVIDDGRRASLWERLTKREVAKQPELPVAEQEEEAVQMDAGEIVEVELRLPPDFVVKGPAIRQCLTALRGVRHPLAFEILGRPDVVSVQLACSERDAPAVVGTLKAYFPEIRARRRAGVLLGALPNPAYGAVLELGLQERVFRSLREEEKFDTDPLIAVISRLGDIAAGECAFVQVLFQRAVSPWGKELLDLATNIDDVDKVLPDIRSKFAEPMYAAALRVAAFSDDGDVAVECALDIASVVAAATRSENNSLQLLEPGDGIDVETQVRDMLERQTRRSGVLLSLSELLTLVHPPSASVRSERFMRQSSRTKAAPLITSGHSIVLGTNEHDGEETVVSLSPEQRSRHVCTIGASGTGKSTLLVSMAAQDIALGNGFAVLDPHGDLVDDILDRIPEDRAEHVILFDPADEEFPIGFNILSAHSELERTLLASDLVSVFKRLSTTFGDVMMSVLGNAVLAFLESSEGGTLLDLRNFLVDPAFRDQVLRTVQDEEVVSYWKREFTLLKGVPHAPVLTRLNTFLRPRLIRRMVAQKRDRVDFRHIMDKKTIFLAKLSHGAIGEENAHLLGSLLVSKIAQAAMSRQNIDAAKREAYTVYIDEFHHFVTPSIATILSGARKYGLGLVLAHQEMRQLKTRNEEVASAVLANAATRVVFRVGEQDAKALADGFTFFESKDLQSLSVGEAIARVDRADYDFNLRTHRLKSVESATAERRRGAVVAASRAQYAVPRAEVDALFSASRESIGEADIPLESPAPSRNTKKAKSPDSDDAVLPGRGGAQHKYLQSLVRRLADDRGFDVSLERTVLDGHGHVDVLLEGHNATVAIEISVTTKIEHEIGNLAKCLAAGFDYAVLVSSDDKTLDLARAEMSSADPKRVRITTPGGLSAILDEIVGAASRAMPKKGRGAPPRPSNPTGNHGREVMSPEAAASYVGLAVQTLAKMRVSGESPPFHKLGRRVVYDPKDLDEWLAQRKRRSTSDSGPRKPSI